MKNYSGKASIPPTVYMEMCLRYLERNDPIDRLNDLLGNLEINVLRFDRHDAYHTAALMAGRNKRCTLCNKIDWVDTIVASYATNEKVIVTNNIKDFPTSEEFEKRILTTDQIMNQY